MLYLASRSPRRKELLTQIGVPFKSIDIEVDESQRNNEIALDYVQRVAKMKAECGWDLACNEFQDCAAVLGSDTSVVLEHRILGKPQSRQHGIEMLRQLSGKTHQVITAVTLKTAREVFQATAVTEVRFCSISDQEIARYWDTQEPHDKAGSYGIQGLAAVFIEHMVGNYSTVVGLPLFETAQLLRQAHIPVWQGQLQSGAGAE